jgi:carboxypeptidase family protein
LRNVNTGIESVKETDAGGRYLFDFVQPGTYLVSVEASGFSRYLKENITVLTKSDVTVSARLSLGGVAETVNVSAEALILQYNTSTMSTTVVGEMLKEIPVLARNPFTLTLLNPAGVNRYWDVSHRNPFYMWSSGGLDVGGATGGKNDILLDGVPLGVSALPATKNRDALSEFSPAPSGHPMQVISILLLMTKTFGHSHSWRNRRAAQGTGATITPLL